MVAADCWPLNCKDLEVSALTMALRFTKAMKAVSLAHRQAEGTENIDLACGDISNGGVVRLVSQAFSVQDYADLVTGRLREISGVAPDSVSVNGTDSWEGAEREIERVQTGLLLHGSLDQSLRDRITHAFHPERRSEFLARLLDLGYLDSSEPASLALIPERLKLLQALVLERGLLSGSDILRIKTAIEWLCKLQNDPDSISTAMEKLKDCFQSKDHLDDYQKIIWSACNSFQRAICRRPMNELGAAAEILDGFAACAAQPGCVIQSWAFNICISIMKIPWCRSAMQDYIQKVLRQIDELTEQQISAVALFLAVAGSSGGEGRQLLESSFSCLPVLSCAMCLGSSMFCMLYLQASMSQFKMIQVAPNEPVNFSSEVVEPSDCDSRFPGAAVLPVQGLWFIEWLQRRIQASNPGRLIVYTGLNHVCAQLSSLTDALRGHGIGYPSGCIPFKWFLKLEGEMSSAAGDWLDHTERHSYLRNELFRRSDYEHHTNQMLWMQHCREIMEEIIEKHNPDSNASCDWLLLLLHWCCNYMVSTQSNTAEPESNTIFLKDLVITLTSEHLSKSVVKHKLLCLCEILGSLSLTQLSALGVSGSILLDLIREEFAPHLMNTYKPSILHLALTALQGLDQCPDFKQFIGENSFVLHNMIVGFQDWSRSEHRQALMQCSKVPTLQKLFKLAPLATKISCIVFHSDGSQELTSGWQSSISIMLEIEGGSEVMARSFVSQFVQVICCAAEDCLKSSADQDPLKKEFLCMLKSKSLISINKLLEFLQHYSLMDTVGCVIAELCLACSSESSVITLQSKSHSIFEDMNMMIALCLQDLVCEILKCHPPFLNQISGCSICLQWEMGAKQYTHHKMDNILLCHAASSIASSFKHLTPGMDSLCGPEATNKMYGCMFTLLRVHSALSKMLGIKIWCQVHGVWMANAKRVILDTIENWTNLCDSNTSKRRPESIVSVSEDLVCLDLADASLACTVRRVFDWN